MTATGDLHVDEHHTVEDVGIALGQAFDTGARRPRAASSAWPTRWCRSTRRWRRWRSTSAAGRTARSTSTWTLDRIGELPSSLVEHLLSSIATEAKLTLHARVLKGENDHHSAEAMCKALGRALAAATRIEPRRGGAVPSTKGTLG